MAQGHTTQERQGWQEESHLLDHRGVEGVQAAVKSHALKANKVGHLHPGRILQRLRMQAPRSEQGGAGARGRRGGGRPGQSRGK